MESNIRCTKCYAEFTPLELQGATGCPVCKTNSVPMSVSEDVTVKINWHELRILSIWAENWANHIEHTEMNSKGSLELVYAIASRLQHQHPFKTPLTLSGEIQEQRDKGIQLNTNVPEGGSSRPAKNV